MKKVLKIIIGLLIFVFTELDAQNTENYIEIIIESIVENLAEETDAIQLVEDLQFYAENPININQCTEKELASLYLLNAIQIQQIIDYRKNFGLIYSIYELNTIESLNRETLEKLTLFIWFGPEEEKKPTFSEQLKWGKHEWLGRTISVVQKQNGYQKRDDGTIPFEGNPMRIYSRYRFQNRENLSVGITAEKDPGEAFFSQSNKTGFDFYSGHLSFKINKIFEQLIVGDYLVRAGQGLVLWQGYSNGKSLNTTQILKTNQGIKPFTSTDENQFFRGLASTARFGKAQINLFYSQQNNDANLEMADSVFPYFTSLQTSGYHRTANEIVDENAISNQNIGGFASYIFNHLKIGSTIHFQHFSETFIRPDQVYNRFRFSGKNNFAVGSDYLYSKGKYQLFGEAAVSKSKGKAFLQGLTAHLDDQFIYTVQFRHFEKNYHALWANAFSESSDVENESGVYFGTKILPWRKTTLSAYADFYEAKWVKYNTMGPANGYDFFVQADYLLSEKINFYIRYKNEEKNEKFVELERFINQEEQIKKTRFHFEYLASEQLKLKTRFEHCFYKGEEKEHGFLVYQDVQLNTKKVPLQLTTRLAYFNTESYNSRIYTYENDILYSFSIPAFFGKGIRAFCNLKYQISEQLDFYFKLENTLWNKRETISSGYNLIEGKNKTTLKFQLRLKI